MGGWDGCLGFEVRERDCLQFSAAAGDSLRRPAQAFHRRTKQDGRAPSRICIQVQSISASRDGKDLNSVVGETGGNLLRPAWRLAGSKRRAEYPDEEGKPEGPKIWPWRERSRIMKFGEREGNGGEQAHRQQSSLVVRSDRTGSSADLKETLLASGSVYAAER
jgi:hypothetical protein